MEFIHFRIVLENGRNPSKSVELINFSHLLVPLLILLFVLSSVLFYIFSYLSRDVSS